MSEDSDLLEELRAHEEDLAIEARERGLSSAASEVCARQQLGDVTPMRIRAQKALILRRLYIACGVISVAIGCGAYFVATAHSASLAFTLTILLLTQIALIGTTLFLVRSAVVAHGANRLRGFVHAAILVCALVSAEICILDVDHIEVIILFALITACILLLMYVLKDRASIRVRFMFVYTLVGGVFLTLILSEWFGLAERIPLCLYVTPDSVPVAQCHFFVLSKVITIALGLVLIISIGSAFITLNRVLKTSLLSSAQKWMAIVTIVTIFCVPIFIHDINNYSALSVVFAQPKITQAYSDILGRNPERKDLDFYALTGAYRNIDRIRSVLLASEERELKIQEVYMRALHRTATLAEIVLWNERGSSLDQIQKSVESFK